MLFMFDDFHVYTKLSWWITNLSTRNLRVRRGCLVMIKVSSPYGKIPGYPVPTRKKAPQLGCPRNSANTEFRGIFWLLKWFLLNSGEIPRNSAEFRGISPELSRKSLPYSAECQNVTSVDTLPTVWNTSLEDPLTPWAKVLFLFDHKWKWHEYRTVGNCHHTKFGYCSFFFANKISFRSVPGPI
jgi:hypothetical protein